MGVGDAVVRELKRMKILMIHNEYGALSGEEVQFYNIADLLAERGHEVGFYVRSSAEVYRMKLGLFHAFLSGIYSPKARRDVTRLLGKHMPDIVFVGNLFPLISPAILPVCHRAGVPVIMRVPNYRLMCPNGLHMCRGHVCERCLDGKDYWCFLRNCEDNVLKSAAYALRNWVAHKTGWFKNHVSAYICASHFLQEKMIEAGFDPEKIHIIPNVVPDMTPLCPGKGPPNGSYVGYVGRISHEKGIHTLVEAARCCPKIPFRLAGRMRASFRFRRPLPENVKLVGSLTREELSAFYSGANFTVCPSQCFETFGNSIAEAMLRSKAVIASKIGALSEVIDDGINGLLVLPGNPRELAQKIHYLWERPQLASKLGKAGREKALREFAPQEYYVRLKEVFDKVARGPAGTVKKLGRNGAEDFRPPFSREEPGFSTCFSIREFLVAGLWNMVGWKRKALKS